MDMNSENVGTRLLSTLQLRDDSTRGVEPDMPRGESVSPAAQENQGRLCGNEKAKILFWKHNNSQCSTTGHPRKVGKDAVHEEKSETTWPTRHRSGGGLSCVECRSDLFSYVGTATYIRETNDSETRTDLDEHVEKIGSPTDSENDTLQREGDFARGLTATASRNTPVTDSVSVRNGMRQAESSDMQLWNCGEISHFSAAMPESERSSESKFCQWPKLSEVRAAAGPVLHWEQRYVGLGELFNAHHASVVTNERNRKVVTSETKRCAANKKKICAENLDSSDAKSIQQPAGIDRLKEDRHWGPMSAVRGVQEAPPTIFSETSHVENKKGNRESMTTTGRSRNDHVGFSWDMPVSWLWYDEPLRSKLCRLSRRHSNFPDTGFQDAYNPNCSHEMLEVTAKRRKTVEKENIVLPKKRSASMPCDTWRHRTANDNENNFLQESRLLRHPVCPHLVFEESVASGLPMYVSFLHPWLARDSIRLLAAVPRFSSIRMGSVWWWNRHLWLKNMIRCCPQMRVRGKSD